MSGEYTFKEAGQLTEREAWVQAAVDAVSAQRGIDREMVRGAAAWAIDWVDEFNSLVSEQPTVSEAGIKELVTTSRTTSLEQFEALHGYQNGSLTLRTADAARDIFYLSFGEKTEDMRRLVEGDGAKMVVDWRRTDAVLGELLDAYGAKRFPYNQDSVRLPHDHRHLPENLPLGGREHAMFLWCGCYYMRGGVKSVDAFKLLAKVYREHPDLFDSQQAAGLDGIAVGELLRSFGLGYQHKQIGNFWIENARRLEDQWGGDPRNIFEKVDTYEECLQRIQNDGKGAGFLGFQEKMTSMITYYLMDEQLIDYFVFPLPIDLHVLRVTVANELIRFEGFGEDDNVLSNTTLSLMRQLYYDYAVTHNVSPLHLSDAVWLLSQSLCGRQPGNITLEPNGRAERNGRNTVLAPLSLDLNDPRQRRMYDRSCAHCPTEPTCVWNVPGKYYYVQGILRRRGKRIAFPPPAQGVLFNWQENSL